jgi:hypothetical protein
MDIGWTAETFPEHIAVHIAKARSASRGAAIDAHEQVLRHRVANREATVGLKTTNR